MLLYHKNASAVWVGKDTIYTWVVKREGGGGYLKDLKYNMMQLSAQTIANLHWSYIGSTYIYPRYMR